MLFRLDEKIVPTRNRLATVSSRELGQLSKVKNIIRKGRLKAVTGVALLFKWIPVNPRKINCPHVNSFFEIILSPDVRIESDLSLRWGGRSWRKLSRGGLLCKRHQIQTKNPDLSGKPNYSPAHHVATVWWVLKRCWNPFNIIKSIIIVCSNCEGLDWFWNL